MELNSRSSVGIAGVIPNRDDSDEWFLPSANRGTLDGELRLAGFEWLAARTHDGQLPLTYLEIEEFRYGDTGIRLRDRYRGIWKPAQLRAALSFSTTYRAPGQARPYNDRFTDEGLLVYKWRKGARSESDNRALIEANAASLPLTYFYGIAQGVFLPVFPVLIVDVDSENEEMTVDINPLLAPGLVDLSISKAQIEIERKYAHRMAPVRLHQRAFSSTVLRAYKSQCAVCSLRHVELLDAAHIIPDSHEDGVPHVTNGLALCKIHHAAFDSQILGISPDLVVHVREDLLKEIDGPMLRHGLQGHHLRPLAVVPERRSERPSTERLKYAFDRFKTGKAIRKRHRL